jgi:hypothetical protein
MRPAIGVVVALTFILGAYSASAKGCIKGAIVGGGAITPAIMES